MNRKVRLLAVASMVAIMASGCSSYRGSSQASVNAPSGGFNSGSGQVSRGGQVAGSGQVARRGGFGQQRSRGAVVNDSCAACAASKAQSTYTYKPAKPAAPVARAPAPAVNSKSQQYYIDRWNRQQAQQQQRPAAPKPAQNTNYAGYGQNGQSNTTYYDYSSAARANTQAPAASNATSNKSIYTGSYQQKTYAPTTYSGGSAATTNSGSSAVNTASAGGGSTYSVKKGDTVFEIMRQTGVYWKDIISINNLQPPYNISPGQTLSLK